PEIAGRRIGSARPEWQVFGEVMARLRPQRAQQITLPAGTAIRAELARAVAPYAGIGRRSGKGGQFQRGGPPAYADGRFATQGGKARFSEIRPRGAFMTQQATPADADRASAGHVFRVSTRRGKQFNSMVQRDIDPLTGAHRDDVLISADDLVRLALH